MAVKKPVTREDIKADVVAPIKSGENALIAPDGSSTIVPDSIVDILLESGYKRK